MKTNEIEAFDQQNSLFLNKNYYQSNINIERFFRELKEKVIYSNKLSSVEINELNHILTFPNSHNELRIKVLNLLLELSHYQKLPKSSLSIIQSLTLAKELQINKLANSIITSSLSTKILRAKYKKRELDLDIIDIKSQVAEKSSCNLIKIIPTGIDTKVKIIFTDNIRAFLIKENQEIEINHENLPIDLKKISTPELFESTLRDAYIRVSALSNGDVKLYINQRLYGGGNSASNNNTKGDEYFKSGDYHTAKSYYQQARNLDIGNTTYKENLAITFCRIGSEFYKENKYHEALEAYSEALSLCPSNASYHDNKGDALKALGRNKEAVESYDQAIKLDPKNAVYLNDKGNALYNLQMYEDAVSSYEEAIKLKSNIACYHSNKANTLNQLERYDEALESANAALKIDSNYDSAKGTKVYVLYLTVQKQKRKLSTEDCIFLKKTLLDSQLSHKKNACLALRYAAENKQKLPEEGIQSLEKALFDSNEEIINNAANAFYYIVKQGNRLSKNAILGLESALSKNNARWNASAAFSEAAEFQKQKLPDTTLDTLAKLLADTKAPLQARKNSSSALCYSAQKGIKFSSNILSIIEGASLDKEEIIQNNAIKALSFSINDGYKVNNKTVSNIEKLLTKQNLSESVSAMLASVSAQKYDLSTATIADLVKILEDKSYKTSVHINAVISLKNVVLNGQILDAKGISVLTKKLSSDNAEIKNNASYALAYCTKYSPEILDILEQHLLDKDVSAGASYAFKKNIKQNSDLPSGVIKKLTELLSLNYNDIARNNAVYIIKNLAESSYKLSKNTLYTLEKVIIDESVYIKNNAMLALGYAARSGYYIASNEVVDLLKRALNDTTTYDSSKLALKYLKNNNDILDDKINDKKRISSNTSSDIYKHLKVPTGNIKTELQKTIVQEDNQIARTKEKSQDKNLTLTSLEEALAGKTGNTEQGVVMENLPGQILNGDNLFWYKTTSSQIHYYLTLVKDKKLLTQEDFQYLTNKLSSKWKTRMEIFSHHDMDTDIALIFKYTAENGQLLSEDGLIKLTDVLSNKVTSEGSVSITGSIYRNIGALFTFGQVVSFGVQRGGSTNIDEFKKNATAALSYAARNKQELSPETVRVLEQLSSDKDPEVIQNVINALSYIAQYSRKSISLEKLEQALLDKKTSVETSYIFLQKTKEKEILSEQALINLSEVLVGDYNIKARENSIIAIATSTKNGQKVPNSLISKLLDSVDDYYKEIRNNAIYALSFIARNGQVLSEDILPKLENDLLNSETALSAMFIFEKAIQNKQDINYKVFDTLSDVIISNLEFRLRSKAIDVLGFIARDNQALSKHVISNLEHALNDNEIAIKDEAALLYNANLNLLLIQGDEFSDHQVSTILRLCSKDFSPDVRVSTIFTFCNMARNGQKLSEEALSVLEFAVLGKNMDLAKYSIESLELYTKFKIDLPRSTINILEKSLENKELRNHLFPVIKNIISNNQELSEYTLQDLSKFLYMPAKEEVYKNALAMLEIADTNIELPPDVDNILELEQYGNIIKKTSDDKIIRNSVKKLRESANKGSKLSDNNLEIITDLLEHKDDNIKYSCIYALHKIVENSQKLSEKSINKIGKLITDPSLDIEAVKTLEHVVKNGQILPEDIIKTLDDLILDSSLSKYIISIFKTLSNRGMNINNSTIKAANDLITSKGSDNQTKRDATSLLVSVIQNNQDLDITHSLPALNAALKDPDDTIVKYAISACKLISQKQNKLPAPILEQFLGLAENNNRELSHNAIEALEAAIIIQPKDISSKFDLIKSRQILNSTSDIKTRYNALKELEYAVKSKQKLLYSNFIDLELMLKETDEDLRVLTAKILNNYIKNNNELPESTVEAITSVLDDSSINIYTSEILLKVIEQKNSLPDKTLEKLCSLLIDKQELEVYKNTRQALEIAKHRSSLSKDILNTLSLEDTGNELTKWLQSSKLTGLLYDKYWYIYESIKNLNYAAENKILLPFSAVLSLGRALADKKVCQNSLKVIALATKNGQHLPKMLLNDLEDVLLNNDKTNKIIATEIFTQVLQNGQKLENSNIEVLESLIDQDNNYIIPTIKYIMQDSNDYVLQSQTLEKLATILLNNNNSKILYDIALIIRSASQKHKFLPEKVINCLSKVLYDSTYPDIQKLAFSALRYCIQNGQDCTAKIKNSVDTFLTNLSQEVGSETLTQKLKDVPFNVELSILDTILSREYLNIKIIKNSPIENWSRNLLCSDLLDHISDKQETEIYKFFENLANLEKHNSYDKYDENRDNILHLLIEKQNSDGLNLQKINEILILLKIGHKKALELLSSNSINWEKNLKDQWIQLKLNIRLLPTDIQNISSFLSTDQLHWSLEFSNKFLEARIDNVKQLIDFLNFVKEHNISEFDLNELSKNLSINNLQDWKFHVENNVLKNKLASIWSSSRSLLSRVNDGIDKILKKGWSFHSIEQVINAFGNKEILKSKQDSCEYFVESLNIINSYNITSDSRDIEGLKALDIFEKYKPQEWIKQLHNLAIFINFESEGSERNLDNLLQEIGKINTNNEAIGLLLSNKELLKQFNKILLAYDKPSSLEFSSIVNFDIKNLNFPDFNKPIKEWNQTHVNIWSSMVSKSVDTQSEKFLPEMVAVIKRAMLLHSKHEPRIVQILSVLIMLNSKEKGRLAQIATGEGKSTTVAMLAAIKALQGNQIGEKVDIITSSPLLAKRDAEEQSGFYSMFGLTVGDNGDEVQYSSGPKDCYKKDIVYGDSSNFQFDVLRDEYSLLGTRDGRKFGSVIIDEVDSMLIDESAKIARLANSMPGMEYLEPLFTTIWHELDRLNKRFVKLEGKLHWVGQDFEIKDGIVKIKASEDGDNAILPVDDPYEFTKTHIINNYIDPLISKEKNHIPENLKLRIPEHLRNFVSNQLPKWVDNAILAKTVYKEGHHYLITNDENKIERITPVDFASTGIIQNSTTWSDGLHQFLQIKHGLKITPESLTTNFLSNMGYFRRYENKVYGLTGTLGSQDSQDLLSNIYPVDVVKIPSYKQKQFLEIPGIVAKNESEWLEKTLNNAIGEAKKDRAVLIICETINQAEQIYQGLNKDYISNRVKLYTRNDNDEQKAVNHQIDAGEIIVATNLAGRGTDIKTTKTVEDNGGLHVSVTFLPSNLRVEEQAFGRTSRQGKRGTAVLIVDEQKVKEQLNSIYPEYPNKESSNIATIKDWRNKAESARLKKVRENEIDDISKKDKLFKQFCDLLKELKNIEDDKYRLSAVEERWGLWLKDIDNENQDIYERFDSFKSQIVKEYKQNKVIKNPYYYIAKADSLIDDANAGWTGFKKVMTNIVTLGIAKTGREELREQAIENLTEAINLDPIFSFAAYVSRAYLYIEAKSSDDYKQKARLDLIKAQENISSYIIPQLQNMKLSSNIGNIETNEGKKENFSNQIITKLDILNIYLQHIQQALSVVEESQKLIDVTFYDKTTKNTFAKLTEQEVKEKIIGEHNSKKLIKLSFHDLKLDTGDMVDSDQALNTIDKVSKDYKSISIEFKNLTHDKAKELINKSSQQVNISLSNIIQNKANELIKTIENAKISNITVSFNGLKNYESIEVVNNSNVESVILGFSDNKKDTDINLRIDKENCIRKIQDIRITL